MRPLPPPTSWESLGIVIDRAAEVPIGVQVVWALRARIRAGSLAPGQRLPGLRDLADGLGVNANTIRTVYQRLEHEGLLTSQQGNGTFVAADTSLPRLATEIAARAAREAHQTGADPREVAAALYGATVPSGAVDHEAERRRQL